MSRKGLPDIPTDSGSVVIHSSDLEGADACEVCALTHTAHSEREIARKVSAESFMSSSVSQTRQEGKGVKLPHSTQLIHGPVAEHGFAVDKALVHGAEVAAVVGHGPVIAEHKIRIRRHHHIRQGPRIGVLGRDVSLVKRLAVHIDLSGVDADAIAGHPDHALDIALRGIVGVLEYHDVAAFDRLQAVDELIDEDALLVDQ